MVFMLTNVSWLFWPIMIKYIHCGRLLWSKPNNWINLMNYFFRQLCRSVTKTKPQAQFRFECNARAEFITPSRLRKYGTQWFESTIETRFSSLIHNAGCQKLVSVGSHKPLPSASEVRVLPPLLEESVQQTYIRLFSV